MKSKGLLLVLAGIIFLQISLHLPRQDFAWGMTLAASILLNMTGTVLLMRSLKAPASRN
ncbi:hypothetical protein P4T89_11630 [Bacillus nakamurai]|uniref:hypothetical protein n=1 Tax=Bacillus nakamurai TaxID=1793963 RepID=UPI000A733D70|nr:hypothetical protein [Bacillus nakamurai]MCC9023695.1 hypothetical protein [Bacillus nakamurai]MED1228178.1 hypothetical protein [Bacillus nakamurai]